MLQLPLKTLEIYALIEDKRTKTILVRSLIWQWIHSILVLKVVAATVKAHLGNRKLNLDTEKEKFTIRKYVDIINLHLSAIKKCNMINVLYKIKS